MPVGSAKYTTKDGKKVGFYRWGDSGAKYYFTPGNESARKQARKKAEAQGRAAHASGYKG